jgi:3-phenylpropionate/cinnamic acid dioxygenase small subunit
MRQDREQIEAFLYREARLIDEHRYDEWLSLWTDDGIYWVPCNEDDTDPTRQVSIIYDDRVRLGDRVERLKSGAAWAQEPKSRMRRLIANLEIEDGAQGEVTVAANFLLVELRRHLQNLWAGRTVHRLRPEQGSFKLAYKKVLLINNDEEMPALVFLI